MPRSGFKRRDRAGDRLIAERRGVALNMLTVFNAALNFRYNWQGSFRTLESQAAASIENSRIMGSSVPVALARLRADPATVEAFQAIYSHGPDAERLLDAIAAFE
jgi:cytochrome c peroxidase